MSDENKKIDDYCVQMLTVGCLTDEQLKDFCELITGLKAENERLKAGEMINEFYIGCRTCKHAFMGGKDNDEPVCTIQFCKNFSGWEKKPFNKE